MVSTTTKENTMCQKLSEVEFKPKIFTTNNEIQQTHGRN